MPNSLIMHCKRAIVPVFYVSMKMYQISRNPWRMSTEPWGSGEPRLRNTAVKVDFFDDLE